jgi:A/G-specific adenine glycosylase
VVLVLRDDQGRVLLQRRAASGVWASLWSFPEFDDQAAADEWLRTHARDAGNSMWLDDIAHAFSHYHLTLRPRLHHASPASRIADDGAATWAGPTEIESLGIPAPIRALLNRLFEN